MKVLNDVYEALDAKDYCAALFLDLSKAFDTVDIEKMCQRLLDIGFTDQTTGWFLNYLTGRKQCVQLGGQTSSYLETAKGVPQGSILGPTLFTIYINELGHGLKDAALHLYADDSVIYCRSKSVERVFQHLQSSFDCIQSQLLRLGLTLNADKTKGMLFSNRKKVPSPLPKIFTKQGQSIELVSSYKYLGIHIDDSLTFTEHIESLLKRLKLKLGFFFRNKSCFSFHIRKQLVSATFMSVLDYGDLVYMNASASSLRMLDAVYHGALRFITDSANSTHHCCLYSLVNWPSLHMRRLLHWYLFIYKTILHLVPPYLSCYFTQRANHRSLRSQDFVSFSVPAVRTELGKKAFSFSGPSSWNMLQQDLKLSSLVTLGEFKILLKDLEKASIENCCCFN